MLARGHALIVYAGLRPRPTTVVISIETSLAPCRTDEGMTVAEGGFHLPLSFRIFFLTVWLL